MADFVKHTDTFPLEHLFRRLELAGFSLSPADRLRALRILGGPAKIYLDQPDQLKELLAPVLVRSEAEQLKFYEIFDQYYQEIIAPWEPESYDRPENDFWKWLLVLPLIAVLVFAYYSLTQQEIVAEELSIYIDGPGYGYPGDTLRWENVNASFKDSSDLSWRWSYINLASQKEEAFDTTSVNWQLVVPPVEEGSYLREIRLSVYDPQLDTTYESSLPFTVYCPVAPPVTGIEGGQLLEVDQVAEFKAIADSAILQSVSAQEPDKLVGAASNWVFSWDFEDGTTTEGPHIVEHVYLQNGRYTISLTVTDTTAQGFCTTRQILNVKVGHEQAFLPLADLHKDKLSLLARWSWGFYVLLGLLGLSLLYYWLRWLTRRRQPPTAEEEAHARDKTFEARFAHSDKAPYFIPLRDQNPYIGFSGVQLRLADALRIRQEGLRKEVDLSGTLSATIEKGGFPEVRFQFATQPSEYLCLIDEQNRASHLGNLAKYLARNLREQDVNLEVYYYRKHFNRFWNSYNPKGLSLDQLQRAYGNYRLLVMGDLHELIDPYANNQPNLRMSVANMLRQWPMRLLLTPVPPVSWTYREKLLARVWSVFPIDEEGLAAAALHIENDGELLPDGYAYERWQTYQREKRADSDTEYRKWRKWREIKAYLSAYDPELERWFKALAVFPIPSWEMTIAIGRALKVNISYDNLLRLARIPSLQSDRFDERLRRELLAELDKNDEKLAREAVQRELSAVKAISEGSHAHRGLETALAVQEFALAPFEDSHRETVRFLLRRNLLTPAQEADLDSVTATARSKPVQKMSTTAIFEKQSTNISIREWLEEDVDYELDAPTPRTEDDKKDLRRAVLLTAVYVLLFLLGWKMGGTNFLYKLSFGESQENRVSTDEKPLRDYLFVKEIEVIDSAIVYNNLGVEQANIGGLGDTVAATYFRQALSTANSLVHGKGDQFKGDDISYALANANLSKTYFNAAVQNLNAYLQDSLGQAVLTTALALLDDAYVSDSIAMDILHARGVIHFYAGSPEDSSLYYYTILDSLGYFEDLNYSPNLETLLGRERSRIVAVDISDAGNQALRVRVEYYLDNSVDKDAEIVVEALGSGNQPSVEGQPATAGRGTVDFFLEPSGSQSGRLEFVNVKIRRTASTKTIDAREERYVHNWKQVQPSTRTEPPSPVAGKPFELRGTLLDELKGDPLRLEEITLEEKANRGTLEPQVFTAETQRYGNFVITGNLGRPSAIFELKVTVDGYIPFSRNYTGEELQKLTQNDELTIKLTPVPARPKLVRINGGTFQMGNPDENSAEDERPVHAVRLSDYSIGAYEVTFEEYDLFCGLTGRPKPVDNGYRGTHPVINVSWLDAVAYCNWLSEQHGYTPVYDINPKGGTTQKGGVQQNIPNGYRLPTEAEWEYAARGGIMLDKSHIYAGSSSINTVGWYDGNSKDQTHPVGQLRPNNAGTYDMSGNVWEWCYDWFGGYTAKTENDPFGPGYGSHRIIRGGAWIQQAEDCQVTTRQFRRPEEKTIYIGFRLVR